MDSAIHKKQINKYIIVDMTGPHITQGVLANRFPISIRTQTQGQYRYQKVWNILKNHLPVSDFANMLLNSKITKILQKKKKKFQKNAI